MFIFSSLPGGPDLTDISFTTEYFIKEVTSRSKKRMPHYKDEFIQKMQKYFTMRPTIENSPPIDVEESTSSFAFVKKSKDLKNFMIKYF